MRALPVDMVHGRGVSGTSPPTQIINSKIAPKCQTVRSQPRALTYQRIPRIASVVPSALTRHRQCAATGEDKASRGIPERCSLTLIIHGQLYYEFIIRYSRYQRIRRFNEIHARHRRLIALSSFPVLLVPITIAQRGNRPRAIDQIFQLFL